MSINNMSISPREEVQNEIRDTLVCLSLDEVYGIMDGKRTNKNGKSYRSLSFCRARTLDGEVQIYSPNFIRVHWQGSVPNHPYESAEIFKSVLDCKRWFTRNFAN